MQEFSTKGKSVPTIVFKLDGVELTAYRPKRALLLEIADLAGVASLEDDGPEGTGEATPEQLALAGDTANVCLRLIPKVFDQPSREHLESRFYDPADPFDIMPSQDDPDAPCMFSILMWLMSAMSKKDSEASATGSKSRPGSARRPRASTVTARQKRAASTTGSSRTNG